MIGIHLYRFLQEALNNVSKHAHAHRVQVRLESMDGMIQLVVEDDGAGFDPEGWAGHRSGMGIGLIGMRERIEQLQGHLESRLAARAGHRLVARIPAPEEP